MKSFFEEAYIYRNTAIVMNNMVIEFNINYINVLFRNCSRGGGGGDMYALPDFAQRFPRNFD